MLPTGYILTDTDGDLNRNGRQKRQADHKEIAGRLQEDHRETAERSQKDRKEIWTAWNNIQ